MQKEGQRKEERKGEESKMEKEIKDEATVEWRENERRK